MPHDRLNELTIIASKSNMLEHLQYKTFISNFATQKN